MTNPRFSINEILSGEIRSSVIIKRGPELSQAFHRVRADATDIVVEILLLLLHRALVAATWSLWAAAGKTQRVP